jgi:hypothetical protein
MPQNQTTAQKLTTAKSVLAKAKSAFPDKSNAATSAGSDLAQKEANIDAYSRSLEGLPHHGVGIESHNGGASGYAQGTDTRKP